MATASSVAAGWFASATPALADALDASLPALDASSPYVTAAALAAAALVGVGVKSAVGGSVGGGASGPAPAPPRATPDTRAHGRERRLRREAIPYRPPPLFPLVPAFARQTYRYEVDPGRMWFFEQKQGIGLASTPPSTSA